ncbi:MAG: LysE family transporter [Burkholderiaceae bacterium]|nr:LysE family transporter [Burkholderiaceae bacterium]
MDYLPHLLTVAGVMLLACISPGPDLLAVTSHALTRRDSGLGVATGIAVSHTIWAALAILGMGVIVAQLGWLYGVIRIAGAGYLIYLGGKMLMGARKPATQTVIKHATVRSPSASLRVGLLVGLTNPKAAVFFGSLFVTILPLHAPLWVHGATLGIVGGVSAIWFYSMAALFSTGRVQQGYNRIRRPVDAVMGGLLVALGVKLLFDKT